MNIYDLIANDENLSAGFRDAIKGITVSNKSQKHVLFKVNDKFVGMDLFSTELFDYLMDILNIEKHIAEIFIKEAKKNLTGDKHMMKRLDQLLEEYQIVLQKENGDELKVVTVEDTYQIFKELLS